MMRVGRLLSIWILSMFAALSVSARAEAQAPSQAADRPGTGAWANYDFVPGDRILFYDDFGADNIGDFPRRWDLAAGNWEVVEWEGGRYLRATANGAVSIDLPENLPERFTVEFPASVQHGNAYIRVSSGPAYHGPGAQRFRGTVPSLEYTQAGVRALGNQGPVSVAPRRQDARGNAMVTFRVETHGVSADRLTTEGFGETRAAADNETAEGKQQNRRVELVRQGS